MYYRHILAASALLLGLASAAPSAKRAYSAPTTDGFPDPTAAQLAAIEALADGQLPNQAPPTTLASSSLTAFQLIAFNENFEVAFFSSLIDNITADAPGYNLSPRQKSEVLTVLKTVKAVRPFPVLSCPSDPVANSSNSKKNSMPSTPRTF